MKRQAVRKVQSMGYRVDEIELDEKNGRGIFEIEAKRGGQEYEIELGYPNLNVIKIEKD
nr:PepSY domain-containing protein [Psychrobacter piechaudii]